MLLLPNLLQAVTLAYGASLAAAQLSGRVRPTTTREAKMAKKVCNILDAPYGAVPNATVDSSEAVVRAWNACREGGVVVIPEGNYGLGQWVDLVGGKGVAVNLEGVVYRMGGANATEEEGTVISVRETVDFEFYSGNSKGAVQGFGWEFHKGGCDIENSRREIFLLTRGVGWVGCR